MRKFSSANRFNFDQELLPFEDLSADLAPPWPSSASTHTPVECKAAPHHVACPFFGTAALRFSPVPVDDEVSVFFSFCVCPCFIRCLSQIAEAIELKAGLKEDTKTELHCMTAMPSYRARSVDELRWGDYRVHSTKFNIKICFAPEVLRCIQQRNDKLPIHVEVCGLFALGLLVSC